MSELRSKAATAARQAWTGHVLAVDLLRALRQVLHPVGIPVMPLKGVLLQAWVYDPSWRRRLTDVDVLVPQGTYARAMEALADAGWRCTAGPQGQGKARLPRVPLPVDLHATLFPRGVFRMPSEEVFSRASRDDALFGIPVRRPHPLDVYAHLVGHFAWGRLTPQRAPNQLQDFFEVPAALGLDAPDCAAHLDACGLARAAHYTLAFAEREGDHFAGRVLNAFPHDALGTALAFGSRAWMTRVPDGSKWGVLPAHLLNRSLPQAGVSLFWHLGAAIERRTSGAEGSAGAQSSIQESS